LQVTYTNTSVVILHTVVHCAVGLHDVSCLQGEAAGHVHILQRQAGSGQNTNKHVKWWCYGERHVNASVMWVSWLMIAVTARIMLFHYSSVLWCWWLGDTNGIQSVKTVCYRSGCCCLFTVQMLCVWKGVMAATSKVWRHVRNP